MIRMEANVVMKYCSLIDEFIKVRIFTPDEVESLLKSADIHGREAYQQLVVNACIVDYNDEIVPFLDNLDNPGLSTAFEEKLYETCVEINPSLDINNVVLPVTDADSSPLHLFEAGALAEREEDMQHLADLEERMKARVIGQDDAVALVARAVRKAAVGLRDMRRPVGTFLFCGRTGIGKTELAKALADSLYGEDAAGGKMVRIDCSEYSMPHEYAKLIGAPPGYIGHNDGGQLTEAIKAGGGGIILFDEIEKADSKVHNILLQILDEGRLTDSKGETVSFHDSILIMTSNIGVEEVDELRDRAGFDWRERREPSREDMEDAMDAALRRAFRPEFINRLDEVVLFNSLGEDDLVQIASNMLDEVVEHGLRIGLKLRYDKRAARLLARQGWSAEFGARELRRKVRDLVESALADEIVDGDIRSGQEVTISAKSGEIIFRTRPTEGGADRAA